ncbi:hypothetical protein, partial [Pseudomonas sp. RTB2]
MTKSVRITITIPSETLEDIDVVSGVIGVTRSALMSNLLSEDAKELRYCLLRSPHVPLHDQQPPIRDRGGSSAEIR